MLEVGGGLGVLSEFLAPRVAHLHVVEVDRSLEAPLARRSRRSRTPRSTWPTRSGSTSPSWSRPGKVVANLPYGVAATVLLSPSPSCPARSSGSRWSSARWPTGWPRRPAARATGPPRCWRSSPARCASCARSRARSSIRSRTSTRRSWCSVAAARRRRAELVALVHAGFAHRRKALAGSLALDAGRAGRHPRRHPLGARASSATRRTPGPRGCRRRTGRGWPRRWAGSGSGACDPR